MIYLDNNATSRPSDAVADAVDLATRELWANPSSVHRAGQEARHAVELARRELATLLGVTPKEVVLTSGGTESVDLAIRGVIEAAVRGGRERPALVTTRIEHAAVRELAEHLESSGVAEVRWLPLDARGMADPGALPALLGGAALVSVQWANNETGVIQPVERIHEVCRAAGVPFHCDGVQWVGKMPAGPAASGDGPALSPLRREAMLPCDLLTFSAHKFHGPKGVGGLWVRRGVALVPQARGTQEMDRRGGTENVAAIVGAGVAAREACEWLARPEPRARAAALRDRLERAILERVPKAVVNGRGCPRLWNTVNIGFPRLEAEAMLLLLSERGLCASAGAACSSGSLDPSPVLLAMGVPPEVAHGSIRLSLSRHSTGAEIDEASGIIAEAAARLSASGGAGA